MWFAMADMAASVRPCSRKINDQLRLARDLLSWKLWFINMNLVYIGDEEEIPVLRESGLGFIK